MASKWLKEKPKTEEQLRQAVESLAKTANQRLRELEKYRKEGEKTAQYSEHSSAYAYIEKLAFDKGKIKKGEEHKREFIDVSKSGKPIFSRKVKKMDEDVLKEEYKQLLKFLGAKTSTVAGTKEHMAKSYEAFKSTGVDIEEERYRGFWDDELIKHTMELFYSNMNSLFTIAEQKEMSAEEFTNVLEKLGITDDITPEQLEKNKITAKSVLEELKKWKRSGLSATDGKQINNPEDE